MRDLMAKKSNKNGHVQYFVAESKERPFIGCEDRIVFDKKNQESDDISVGLELAIAKLSNNLIKITKEVSNFRDFIEKATNPLIQKVVNM